jgi:hypothetical protein
MGDTLEGGKRDNINTSQFAVTNITEDYILDCNANADLSTADVLGTLIRELIRKGIIHGTVA